MASRAQLVEEVIRPALGRGEVVVSDRFTLANVVYQGHAGGMNPADLWSVGRVVTGGLEPDLTLVFDVCTVAFLGLFLLIVGPPLLRGGPISLAGLPQP